MYHCVIRENIEYELISSLFMNPCMQKDPR